MTQNQTLSYLSAIAAAVVLSACAGNYKLTTNSGGINNAIATSGMNDPGSPTGGGPTTGGPISDGPNTGGPTTGGPITDGPNTGGPTTGGPISDGPNTGGPTTGGPITGGSNNCPPGASCTHSEQGPETEICILAGNGKSDKLGLNSDGKLAGQRGVPGALCMSVNACLNIASQKLDVQGLFPGNPCANNPNVVPISDSDMQALINKM